MASGHHGFDVQRRRDGLTETQRRPGRAATGTPRPGQGTLGAGLLERQDLERDSWSAKTWSSCVFSTNSWEADLERQDLERRLLGGARGAVAWATESWSRSSEMSPFRELPLCPTGRLLATWRWAFGVLLRVPEMGPGPGGRRRDLRAGARGRAERAVHGRDEHRTEVENFSVTDAVWVPALILCRRASSRSASPREPGWTCLPALGLVQVAFNAGQFVVAITVAGSSTGCSISVVVQPHDLRGGAVAMSCYFAINEISVALITLARKNPLREVVSSGGLNLLHAGGTSSACSPLLVWHAGPMGLPC